MAASLIGQPDSAEPQAFLVGSKTMSDCVFCRLISGQAEVSVVYEDERTVTFMDIQPAVRGHMLVVPRRHAASLADLDAEDGAQLFRVGQLAAAASRASGIRCEGVNFFLADGEAAGQDVFHAHLHVIPRHEGDEFASWLSGNFSEMPRAELEETARALTHAWPRSRHQGTTPSGS